MSSRASTWLSVLSGAWEPGVIDMRDLAVLTHGAPQVLRADNGLEFIAAGVGRWDSEHDTLQAFIPPGQPWLGGFVESLHNRMRDDLLEDNMFEDLGHARALIGAWSRGVFNCLCICHFV